jgi:hypothetical protein
VSPLVAAAIERAGLGDVLAARTRGDRAALAMLESRIRLADLLALGALADAIRVTEVGPLVRLHTDARTAAGAAVLRGSGLELLREVACARVLGERAARVCVDWSTAGLELAQIALGFGASELLGPLRSKRGLPIAEGATKRVKGEGQVPMTAIKQRQLEAMLRAVGRSVEWVGAPAREEVSHA